MEIVHDSPYKSTLAFRWSGVTVILITGWLIHCDFDEEITGWLIHCEFLKKGNYGKMIATAIFDWEEITGCSLNK